MLPDWTANLTATPAACQSLSACDSAPPLRVELSFVIPVFNGQHTLATVVGQIAQAAAGASFEVVLVNDGSSDHSAAVCRQLHLDRPHQVLYVELLHNFGEHAAVFAGLHYCRGHYAVIVDDDGQHSPREALRLWQHARQYDLQLVYSQYRRTRQSAWRRAASAAHNTLARQLLGAPRRLYLSSFKVLRRDAIERMLTYRGQRPFIDALALQAASRIGQLEVTHLPRLAGQSNYTLARLIRLWSDLVFGFTRLPCYALLGLLMVAALAGLAWWQQSSQAIASPVATFSAAAAATSLLAAAMVLACWLKAVWGNLHGRPAFIVRQVVGTSERPAIHERGLDQEETLCGEVTIARAAQGAS